MKVTTNDVILESLAQYLYSNNVNCELEMFQNRLIISYKVSNSKSIHIGSISIWENFISTPNGKINLASPNAFEETLEIIISKLP